MKKKLISIMAVILVVASIVTITVYATKLLTPDWVQHKISKGFTEDDAYKIMAIVELSEERKSKNIEKRYEELGDWDKVAQFYNIDEKAFNKFVEMQYQLSKDLQIPEKIYKQMQKEGMSDQDCIRLAMNIKNAGLEIENTWKAMTKGEPLDELIKENTEKQTAVLQAATDFAFGYIDEKSYLKTIKKLDSDMTEKEALDFAQKQLNKWIETRKAATDITDAEIELAKEAGITNILQICELKTAEKLSNLTYEEMLKEIKGGNAMQTVINDNRSEEKIKALRKKHKGESN